MLLPFLHVLAKSLSDEAAVMAGYVGLVPIGFNLRTYKYVINNYEFLRSLYVSVVVTGRDLSPRSDHQPGGLPAIPGLPSSGAHHLHIHIHHAL